MVYEGGYACACPDLCVSACVRVSEGESERGAEGAARVIVKARVSIRVRVCGGEVCVCEFCESGCECKCEVLVRVSV